MKKDILHLVGLSGTYEILKILQENPEATFSDISHALTGGTLAARRKMLLKYKLISHTVKLSEGDRKEFYTLLPKGLKVLKLLDEILAIEEKEH